MRTIAAILAGLVVGAVILRCVGSSAHVDTRLVPEDASAPLRRLALHYTPDADAEALPVYRQLVRELPVDVELVVEVARAPDYDTFLATLAPRQHTVRVVVGEPITTWSRDRYAALVDGDGRGSILAPPRVETPFRERAGDMQSPAAVSRALYDHDPTIATAVFEGGDLVATHNLVFADANLVERNTGRGVGRPGITRDLRGRFAQELVWLEGDIPQHHMMMYMVPVDDHTVVVGDVHRGVALLGESTLALDPVELHAARFDHAAQQLAARGFRVVRAPVLVLRGAGSYVTYTNALFDRRGEQRIVYLPTYGLRTLDAAAIAMWRDLGFEVHPIDVSTIYELAGSLGCLVNVLARA